MPWYLGNSNAVRFFDAPFFSIGFPVLIVWSAVWGGLAIWHAARRGDKWWFIAFMLIHTVGILEIIYLVFVVKAFEKRSPAPSRRT